jgi:hypothetical protein
MFYFESGRVFKPIFLRSHLYRYHRIFQCERCNELFVTEEVLKTHFMAVKSCELQPPSPAEGITDAIEKKLRSRKKTHREQSAEEKWKEIYGILFPNQSIPSACKFVSLLPTMDARYCQADQRSVPTSL